MRMTPEQIEREQIEQVFNLTGGELERKPLIIAARFDADGNQSLTWPEGTPRILVTDMTEPSRTVRYWYEGVPEYMTSDYRASYGELDPVCMTIIENVTYGEPDRLLVLPDGSIWLHVETLVSSGEKECPFREYDPGLDHDPDYKGSDEAPFKVTRRTAQLTPKPEVRREPTKLLTGAYYRRPNARRAECPFCEARIGEEHGYIYLGDGEAEVIYQQVGFIRGAHPEDGSCSCDEDDEGRLACGFQVPAEGGEDTDHA